MAVPLPPPPPIPAPVATSGGFTSVAWQSWFSLIPQLINSGGAGGGGVFLGAFTTAGRPASPTAIGNWYLDTTLGQVAGQAVPVWCTQLSPIIWCDASGAAI